MVNLARIFSNTTFALALRILLGSYLIYIGRVFYADPLASFRSSRRSLPFDPWVRRTLRAIAAFCLWGGCFIIAAAIAVRIFNFHGYLLAVALGAVATGATWLLLPNPAAADDHFRLRKMRERR